MPHGCLSFFISLKGEIPMSSRIILPVNELKSALAGLGKVIQKKPTIPILGYLHIQRTKDGWIVITATDLHRFIQVRLEQPTEGLPASILIQHHELVRITKELGKHDTFGIQQVANKKAKVILPSGRSFDLPSLPDDEFAEVPKLKSDPISITPALRGCIQQAFECASTDETRHVVNGAYIDVSDKRCHQIVATDGRHLFASNSFTIPLKESIILPTHKFLDWREFKADGEWRLKVETIEDHAWVQISSRRWRFISKQHEGNYPNYRQVIPDVNEFKSEIHFDPKHLDRLVQQIEQLPDPDLKDHCLHVETIQGRTFLVNPDNGVEKPMKIEAKVIKTYGEDSFIGVNREFMTKAFRFGMSRLQIKDEQCPMRFSTNEGQQMIVMPVRASVAPSSATEEQEEQTEPGEPETVDSAPLTSTERNPIMKQPESSDGTDAISQLPCAIDQALEVVDGLRDQLQEGLSRLRNLHGHLKQIQKDQKSSTKEMQTFRNRLKDLQSIRL